MSKSQITFNKKNEKKEITQKQQKIEKKEFNKTNNDKGKSLEELFAYVDEHGNISDRPAIKLKEGESPSMASNHHDEYSFGKVVHYNNDSNYGFIRDNETQQSIYFNDRLVGQKLNLNQKVKFKFKSAKQGAQVTEVLIEY